MMNGTNDKSLLQKVNQRLSRTGTGGKTRVVATVRRGDVTLSGTLQYEIQRKNLLRAATSVQGVRRVVDQMTVEKPKPKGL
ncbi:MAG: BON domain-containing protein [Planctomycetes bacterium]|nr:BON domain-containing protein [Planctomycetota bacterium]